MRNVPTRPDMNIDFPVGDAMDEILAKQIVQDPLAGAKANGVSGSV